MANELLPHEKAGRAIRILGILGVVVFICIFFAVAIPVFVKPPPNSSPLMLIPMALMGAIPLFVMYIGTSVMQHKDWARIAGMVYGGLILLAFPIGTVLGAYILWILAKKWDVNAELNVTA